MSNYSISFNDNRAVTDLLNDFAKANQAGQYPLKIEYKTWRKLSRAKNLEIKYLKSANVILVTVSKQEVFSFSCNDKGFGSFLKDNKFSKKEKKGMDTTLNSCVVDNSCLTYTDHTKADNNYCLNLFGTTAASVNVNGYYNDPYPTTGTTTSTDLTYTNILEDKEEEKKENKDMFDFDFGKIAGDSIRMSPYGIAVKNASGKWVSYDRANDTIMDVEIFNFNAAKYMYKIPVAIYDVEVGDVIIHARKPMIVLDKIGRDLTAVDPVAGEKKTIMPTRSPFGFDFVTKVVSLFDMTGGMNADPGNPFGNMLPFMLLNNENGKNNDIDPFVLMMLATGGGNTMPFGEGMNPMMLALMMSGDGNKDNLLPLMFMMGGCGCNHDKTE